MLSEKRGDFDVCALRRAWGPQSSRSGSCPSRKWKADTRQSVRFRGYFMAFIRTKKPRTSALVALSLLVSALAALSSALVSADPSPLVIIQPANAASQTGRTYGEWSAVWWQTMLALSNDQSPVL